MKDGIYCDGSFREGIAAIGVVVVSNGTAKIAASQIVHVDGCFDAECRAIAIAKEMFPGQVIFNDCQGACEAAGAVWVYRNENAHAHRAAAKAHRGEYTVSGVKMPRHSGIKKGGGLGCAVRYTYNGGKLRQQFASV